MPSDSIGFWVARTRNGAGTWKVCLPMVTWCSCMTSRRADWTLAGARLISSASRKLQWTGPSSVSKPPWSGRQIRVPTRSEGTRSGVNWMRWKRAPEDLGQGGDGAGLGQPRHPFQQQVPAREQGDQDPFQHAFLADDDPLDLKQRRLELLAGDGGLGDRRQAGGLVGHLAGSLAEGNGHSERGRFFHLSVPCGIRHYPEWVTSAATGDGPPRPRGRSELRPRPTMQASGVAAAAAGRLACRPPAPVRREGLGCTCRP